MKDELRVRMRETRRVLTPAAVDQAGRSVVDRVARLPQLASPTTICCYLSVRRELPTGPLIERLRAEGHEIGVPRVIGREEMQVRALVEPLQRGVLGIPTSDGPIVHPTVALCPGLAFDIHGTRLGYGAGYYDRWLSAHPDVVPIGLAYDEAIVPEVPREPHDRRMTVVVTPNRVLFGRPVVRVVAAVWIREGRLFAARRPAGKAHGGLWELPGGKVDAGEADPDALARELSEELGLSATVGEHLATAATAEIDLVAYRVYAEGEPAPTEHDATAWLSPPEWDTVPWAPADRPLLRQLQQVLPG